jgi:hypothetical protein
MLKVNHQIKNGIEMLFSPELPKKRESLILTDLVATIKICFYGTTFHAQYIWAVKGKCGYKKLIL